MLSASFLEIICFKKNMYINIKKVVIEMLLFLILGAGVLFILNRHEIKLSKQFMSEKYNQIPENPDSEDVVGLSLANLSAEEEKEIKEVIKKEYNSQWKYCQTFGDDREINKLYFQDGYQLFKQERETKYGYDRWCQGERNITQKEMDYYGKNITFSKFRKYRDLDDRIGVVVLFGGIYYAPFIKKDQNNSFSSFNIGIITSYSECNYFLFKKIDNQWKIERKLFHSGKHFFDEISIIKQFLKQENNKTSE